MNTADLEAAIQAELTARRGVLNIARKESLGHAREIGSLLVQLRGATERGGFLPALSRCGLSERSAYRYIRLHEQSCHVAGMPEPTTIREAEAAVATPKTLSLVTSKLGNPSIRPLPLDTRSDEEREADAAMAKPSKKIKEALDNDEKLRLLSDASVSANEEILPCLREHGGVPHLVKLALALYRAIEEAHADRCDEIENNSEPEPPKPKGKRTAKVEPTAEPEPAS